MESNRWWVCGMLALALGSGASAAGPRARTDLTALDRYVFRPDSNYRFELVNTLPGQGFTTFILELTSQQWRTAEEVSQPVWKHWLLITRPEQVRTSFGLLFIGGGSNSGRPPRSMNQAFTGLAVGTQSVVAELRMVPNQPVVFADDRQPRTEDEIIAYTWDKFLHGGDDRWPLRLPMTKAAVRAMDTVVAHCAADRVSIDGFVVGGASKRAWTAWTTAAVDRRVVAVVPFVIDLLNLVPSFRHHLAVYGYYAPAVKDYEDAGVMKWLETPRFRALMAIEARDMR